MRSAVHLLNSPRDVGIEFGLFMAKKYYEAMRGIGLGGGEVEKVWGGGIYAKLSHRRL